MANNQVIKRVVMLSAPLAFAALTLFHSHHSPGGLGEDITRWMVVHSLQLVLSVWLAYCVWWILAGVRGAAAQTARAALPIFLVFFSATDAVAGLATGWLTLTANSQSAADRAATLRAVDSLFSDNWLTGSVSVAASIGATAWAFTAIAGAVALHRAGADRLTVALMAVSLVFGNHPPPSGTIGMLALCVAGYLWDRRRSSRADTQPVADSEPESPGRKGDERIGSSRQPHTATDTPLGQP
jgi:hypothetical protein